MLAVLANLSTGESYPFCACVIYFWWCFPNDDHLTFLYASDVFFAVIITWTDEVWEKMVTVVSFGLQNLVL
jgi:hypothetical protein